MSTEDVQAVIGNFAENGVTTVTLLGGEVTTERGDLADILRFSESRGVAVSINTNLVELAPVLPLLDSAALTNIVVSVDGLTAKTHDRIRGTGTFAKTTSSLEILAKHPRVADGSLTVDLTFVLTALNKTDVYALPQFAKRHRINKINFKTLQFNDRAAQNRSQLQLTDKELLDTCSAFYVYCLLEGGLNLDMHGQDRLRAGAPVEFRKLRRDAGLHLCGPVWKQPAVPRNVAGGECRQQLAGALEIPECGRQFDRRNSGA